MHLGLLAQASSSEAMFWLLVIMGLLIGMFVLVGFLRRYLKSINTSDTDQPFVLGDLRKMLREGQITQEEFDRLKVQIVGNLKTPPSEKPQQEPPEAPPPGLMP